MKTIHAASLENRDVLLGEFRRHESKELARAIRDKCHPKAAQGLLAVAIRDNGVALYLRAAKPAADQAVWFTEGWRAARQYGQPRPEWVD